MLRPLLADQRWLQALSKAQPRIFEIISRSPEEQQKAGYFHTLHEIFQQPSTWLTTAAQMISAAGDLRDFMDGIKLLVLTGSGSSKFAGACLQPALRRELGIVVDVIGGGVLLIHGVDVLPPVRPALLVSLARSGDSPESAGALGRLLASDADVRHLILTCNRDGRLARDFRGKPWVQAIALDDRTNDRSLVMTSSFTNLLLAARVLGLLTDLDHYRTGCEKTSQIALELLRNQLGAIAGVASSGFGRVIFLGSGSCLGAARESALKLLEMTGGSVPTMAESYLGFRHGPMSFAHRDTLIVCYLSSDARLRPYETDLLHELNDKKLGCSKVIVGEKVPLEIARENDLIVECPGLNELGDGEVPLIHVLVGQLLAFFRCFEEGLRPDSPSPDDVISRVVPSFKLHIPCG